MLRIAGPDEVATATAMDLSRLLHPSYGFPRRLRLALVPDDAATAAVDDLDVHLAEIVRLDDPRFLAGRAPRRRPGR